MCALVCDQRELQQGAFLVLCVRCGPAGLGDAEQQHVMNKIQDKRLANKMLAFLRYAHI
jgi:hypothetical protein